MGRPRLESIVGKHASEYFTRRGELRNIKSLKFWPLKDVLMYVSCYSLLILFRQKYNMSEPDAVVIADFLAPMLAFNPKERVTAAKCLLHPWIKDVDVENFSTAF
jgi:serine/threonine protein kinase